MSDASPSSAAPETEPRLSRRSIRSFVLRQGRMSAAQHRYLNEMMPRIGVPYAEAPLAIEACFGRRAPLVVEVGFGMGETTARIAQAMPDTDFLAIDVHGPGI